MTAGEASKALAAGTASSVDLVTSCLERIDCRDGDVGAWTFIDREAALQQARACDARPRESALQGIPVALKDVIDTSNMPTEYGSKLFSGNRPARDAACVDLLRKAGCVILGKTVTTEFAMFQPGKTRNPHDPGKTPGGSSSGSAAAVADFQVPVALTTQTSGSTIKPASFCGVLGFKPTFSTVPTFGVRPQAQSLDTVGIVSRSALDLRLVWDALQGRRPHLPPADAVERAGEIRIGICRTPHWDAADDSQKALLLDVARLLERRGVTVTEFALPPTFDALAACHSDLMGYEASRNFVPEYHGDQSALLGPLTMQSLAEGWRVSTDRYLETRRLAALAKCAFGNLMGGFSALIAPPVRGEAPDLATTGDSLFCKIWSLLGVPTIALPVTRGPGGLPLAVQLVGAANEDESLMALAHTLQAMLADTYGPISPPR